MPATATKPAHKCSCHSRSGVMCDRCSQDCQRELDRCLAQRSAGTRQGTGNTKPERYSAGSRSSTLPPPSMLDARAIRTQSDVTAEVARLKQEIQQTENDFADIRRRRADLSERLSKLEAFYADERREAEAAQAEEQWRNTLDPMAGVGYVNPAEFDRFVSMNKVNRNDPVSIRRAMEKYAAERQAERMTGR